MSERRLTIGKGERGFSLPLELTTSTQAILARKRSGKSYTASVEAEEMLRHRQQVVVFDPTSAWWGLRSSADGDGEGYQVVVFGGDHADAPLDYRAGRAMAKAVVEHDFSAIFDIGNLITDEQIEFVMDFSSELLRINRVPLHVFMDEADTFAPQLFEGKLQKKCLGTVSRLVKQGGIKGVGFTMITQRPADINKKVLSQVDILTVLRMSHPLDIKAATDWIKSEVDVQFAKEVEAALPSLPVGTAFFCSAPLGLGERVEVRARRTFNSGATPKPGERKVEPKVLAKVDIEKLGQQISDSVKRSREESPEYLKQRIAQLEVAAGAAVASAADREAIEMLKEKLDALSAEVDTIEARSARMKERFVAARAMAEQMVALLSEAAMDAGVGEVARPLAQPAASPVKAITAPHVAAYTTNGNGGGGTDLQSRILRSLAEFEAIGRTTVLRSTLSAWAKARGGHYENTLGKMRTVGLIDYPEPGKVGLTGEGRKTAPKLNAPPDAQGFFEAVVSQAGTGLRERVMRTLRARYPAAVSRSEMSDLVNARGGHYENTLGSLRSAGFIEYPNSGAVRLQSWTVLQ